ncbi:MAG: DNA polymerase III subunit alpha [Patescibacteria group bacterium]
MSRFVHLHTHSHYSLLGALPKIPELVGEAKKNGMKALALTDSGNMYGAIEFYKECKKEGIAPIIGLDAYVAPRGRKDRERGVDDEIARLILLAKNKNGYQNLMRLVTASYLEGFYNKPRIDRELMEKYGEGLLAISPAQDGNIAHALSLGKEDSASEFLEFLQKTFGKEGVFIEITRHPEIARHEEAMGRLITFAKKNSVPVVASHEVYYLSPNDRVAWETMLTIGAPQNTEKNGKEDFSFLSAKAAEERFADLPEAIEGTEKILSLCDLRLEFGSWVFPHYKSERKSPNEALRDLVYDGLSLRGLKKTKELEERIEYELGIIEKKGYSPYFLTVSDLLRYAREKKITSTTRGSAAGSLVSYLTFITTVNPIEYELPFERFLNPQRPSPPDIDMDIADTRRDEMIEYAKKTYGEDKVAQIGTFGTMMARAAVRDVARALGFSYGTGDRIAKLIPFGSQGFPMTIDRAIEITPELKKSYKDDRDTRTIIDMAKKIEGCVRHISVHAAGVVISPTPLSDFVPLQFDPKGGKLITQYDMHAVEDAGLLKFDFLGIKNLSILANAVELVEKLKGITVDIEKIPLDDKKTFAMLSRGETIGLFQLNGAGMTRYLQDLKPTSIHDVNAMVSLYRPGPLESIPRYIERKHNPHVVSYIDERLKDILHKSYGVITYQDDVLLIAIKLGGYSWLEADKLRKAMGKKIPAEMEAQREKLQKGFIANGMSRDNAEKMWKLIEPFAAYGFNKAHAATYGRVAYQTAYMKANFPVIYMATVLTADAGDVEKIAETIGECKRMGIPVLPPDVNESFRDFTVVSDTEGEKIRFGLYTIKNLGESVAQTIIEERKKNGKYISLQDFLDRVHDKTLNKKSLESLIKCGAMDTFGERGMLLYNMENMLVYVKERKGAGEAQDSLFGSSIATGSFSLLPSAPATAEMRLMWEKELLGLYVSGHPLDKFKEKLQKKEVTIERIKAELQEGMITVVGGIIEEAKHILTKKGEQMMFLKVSDFSGSIEVVIFPRVYEEFKDILVPESCVAIRGRISKRNGGISVIAEKAKTL